MIVAASTESTIDDNDVSRGGHIVETVGSGRQFILPQNSVRLLAPSGASSLLVNGRRGVLRAEEWARTWIAKYM